MKPRAALLLPLAALACAQNNASVRIAAICAPPTDPSACTFTATCSAQYIGTNVIDVAVTGVLALEVQVDNQLPNNANAGLNRTNTNDAFVQWYEIEYDYTLPKSTGYVLGSGLVPANGSAVISVLAIPQSAGVTAATPQGYVLAKMRLHGVLADTTSFETGVFEIPIRICAGCIGVLTCTAPAVPTYCPAAGQAPASAKCV